MGVDKAKHWLHEPSPKDEGWARPEDIVVSAGGLGKCYHIYSQPIDRLKQSLWRGRKRFFQEFWALRDVNLEIRRGETMGIVGSNGAGKSTLLQLICGTVRPTVGELQVRGRVAALLELGAGFNPEFTGSENVRMNAAIMGLSREEINARYDMIVDFADIGQFIDQPVKLYSSGMFVRLAFATAINVSPDILVVDEALAVGDARFRLKCMESMRTFAKEGTLIFVSHDTMAVTELCSRAIWIESGRIRMEGAPKLVVEGYLEYMYEGDRQLDHAPGPNGRLSAARRDLEGFLPIDAGVRQFGSLKVAIEGVRLRSRGGDGAVFHAGQPCEISMILNIHEKVSRPIVGFILKDRLGREIMGDNSAFLKKNLPAMERGRRYLATFRIGAWPNLRPEDYCLTIAVADGTLENHEQLHYLHDAVVVRSVAVRQPAGIFSIADTTVTAEQMDQ